jgi:hypothetical protein
MKLSIEHVFEAISPADFEAVMLAEDFNVACSRQLQLGRQLLRLERLGTRVVRHVCYEPVRKAGDAASEAFGSSKASFVEQLDYETVARRGSWVTIPNQFADRVTNAGTLELVAAPTGTRRIVRGEVKVSAFGFGRLIERAIIAEITKSYEATAAFTRAWLARPAPP